MTVRLTSQQQTYPRFARDVEVNDLLCVVLLNGTQQLEIAEAGTVGNASVLDWTEVSDRSVLPKRTMVLVFGAVATLVSGLIVAQGLGFFRGRSLSETVEEAMES